jgi:hypothetical protein
VIAEAISSYGMSVFKTPKQNCKGITMSFFFGEVMVLIKRGCIG